MTPIDVSLKLPISLEQNGWILCTNASNKACERLGFVSQAVGGSLIGRAWHDMES